MEKSASIGNLAKALAAFQGKVSAIKKDAKNPFFKSSYATLGNIIDTIKQPLAECGLSYCQLPDGDEALTTILMHAETGEYIQATYAIHAIKKDPQGIGSAITYARRYALSAVLGLNTDDDDDGNAANGNGQQSASNGPQRTPDQQAAAALNEKIAVCKTKEQLDALITSQPEGVRKDPQFQEACKRQAMLIKKP